MEPKVCPDCVMANLYAEGAPGVHYYPAGTSFTPTLAVESYDCDSCKADVFAPVHVLAA